MDDFFKGDWLKATAMIPRPPAAVFFEQEHTRDSKVWELLSTGRQYEEVAETMGLTVTQVREIEENWMEALSQRLAGQDVYAQSMRLLEKARRIEQHATHLFLNRENVRAGELAVSSLTYQAKILGLDKHTLMDRQKEIRGGPTEESERQKDQMEQLAEALRKRFNLTAPAAVQVDPKTQLVVPPKLSEKPNV